MLVGMLLLIAFLIVGVVAFVLGIWAGYGVAERDRERVRESVRRRTIAELDRLNRLDQARAEPAAIDARARAEVERLQAEARAQAAQTAAEVEQARERVGRYGVERSGGRDDPRLRPRLGPQLGADRPDRGPGEEDRPGRAAS